MAIDSDSKMQVSSIIVFGRRWFDGQNTYHDAEIIVNGGEVYHRTYRTYGYGDHYLTTATKWLYDQEIIESERPLHRYCLERGIKFITSSVNVASKRDLNIPDEDEDE